MYATYASVYQNKRVILVILIITYLVYEIENLDSMQIQSN